MPDLIPAASNLPERLSDLDGWSATELSSWLEEALGILAAADRRTEQVRLAVGLALWKLRDELGEGDYGREVERLGAAVGVDTGTLRRWRKRAEEHYGLGPPPKAAARVESRLRANARSSATVEASARQVPNADLLVGLDEEVPSAASSASPGAPGSGGLDTRREKPTTPSQAAPDQGPDGDEPVGSVSTTPQEPPAQAPAAPPSATAPAPPAPARPAGAPGPAEAVAALLRFKPADLAGIDGPSLRGLLALARGALEAQAAKSGGKPAEVGGKCTHPKNERRPLGYVTVCGRCGDKV